MRAEIAASRIDAANAQRHQQPCDPVAVSGPLGDQHLALTMLTFGILFGRAGNPHHSAGPRLAALQRQEHADQLLEIEAVGLDAARPPVHRFGTRTLQDRAPVAS